MAENSGGMIAKFLGSPIRVNFAILLIGLILLIFYCAVHSFPPSYVINFHGLSLGGQFLHAMSILAKELGFAALVAVTLNFSIEGFNRGRHNKEKVELLDAFHEAQDRQRRLLIEESDARHLVHIKGLNEKIFQVVYERNIPEEIFREVESQLLRGKFIRCESSYQYTIEKLNDSFVKLHVRHVYSIKNISPNRELHELVVGFDVIKDMASFYKVIKLKVAAAETSCPVPVISDKNEDHEWWQVSLTADVDPESTIQCEFEYERVSTLKGKEVICTLLPSKQLKLQVIDPQGAFSMRAMALHPRAELNQCSSTGSVCYQWQIDGALFPGQGILFDWVPSERAGKREPERAVAALLTSAGDAAKLASTESDGE